MPSWRHSSNRTFRANCASWHRARAVVERHARAAVATAQPGKNLSMLEHLDSPAAHHRLHGNKIPQRSDWPVRFEMSVPPRLAPYAENGMAPKCRRLAGS